MPEGKRRRAKGTGSFRILSNGRWEGRYTDSRDPGTGKQHQISVHGATQKEVVDKLTDIIASLNNGTYNEPSKLTVGQWLDIWTAEYLGGVKPRTLDSYKSNCCVHLKPALGAIKLQALSTHTIQILYNRLGREKGLSPKSIKNLHGVLHKALQQAVKLRYINENPSDAVELPRIEKQEIKPLDDEQIKAFLNALHGHKWEYLYLVTLFTGMRQGEVLGLCWKSVDFQRGTILIDRQLQKNRATGKYVTVTPKNNKARSIAPASFVIRALKEQKRRQDEWHLRAGSEWEDNGLVFTNELGHHLSAQTVYLHYKKIAASIGVPASRFHDLRHSYAMTAFQIGDDVKTVQEALGHHTAAFTLDVYGHVSERMKKDSAARMDDYIINRLKKSG